MKKISRRSAFYAAGAAQFIPAGSSLMAAAPASPGSNVYTRLGVKPIINMTGTLTINGGAPMLPEVRAAMEEATQFAVNLDELMEKAGARVAELVGSESAMITAGGAAALAHATAACIAGGDPEKMKRLPDSRGLRNEILIARQSRNDYDHAFRTAGGILVEFETREQFFSALGHRTAAVMVLGTGEARGPVRLEEISEAAHKAGVPVIVDGAAELPVKPNPFLSRGADLVTYSGGKILRGPQSAGLLIGRKDLIKAAWVNGSPHHGYGRAMKVSKEEVVGMVTAIEMFTSTRDLQGEYRVWESWYKQISDEITQIQSVKTKINPPAGASPFPTMLVSWDPNRVGLTGAELYRQLLDGEPRIMSHAAGEASSFLIRAVAMRPEHVPLVARRLKQILGSAATPGPKRTPAPPTVDMTGEWDVEITFSSGKSTHTLTFDSMSGNQLRGLHVGQTAKRRFRGTIDGSSIKINSTLPLEGMNIQYGFRGDVQGDTMSGDLSLGEFGAARFTGRRQKG